MDFSLTQAQTELAELARKILTDHSTPQRLRELDAAAVRFDAGLWGELGKAGVLSAALPESAGGAGLGLLEQCSVLVETGRAVAAVPYLATITLGAAVLARFGGPAQLDLAQRAGTGSVLLTAALAEDDSAAPLAPSTRADPWSGGWRLTGVKTAVPAGQLAEAMLVPARTPDGVAVFLVHADDAGLHRQPQQVTGGDAAALVELDGCAAEPVGSLADGPEVLGWLVTRGTIGLCALQLGLAERMLELTSDYAKHRVQFGKPIGSFQAVAQRLADAFIDVEGIRLTLWQAAWRLASDLPSVTEVATAKFWAAEAGHRVAHTAVHVHGGVGIDLDGQVHRYFVAAKYNEFALGGATAQLRSIGAALAAGEVAR